MPDHIDPEYDPSFCLALNEMATDDLEDAIWSVLDYSLDQRTFEYA